MTDDASRLVEAARSQRPSPQTEQRQRAVLAGIAERVARESGVREIGAELPTGTS